MWSCEKCATSNEEWRSTCSACGERRPDESIGETVERFRQRRHEARDRRQHDAEREAAYEAGRHEAMKALGLESSHGDRSSSRYEGVMSEHAVSVAWHTATENNPASTRIKVEFPAPIAPVGLVVSHRPVLRPFVTRLDHDDGSSRYVGAFTPTARSRWLTPGRAAVVRASVAIRISRRYLGLAEPGLLPTIVVVSHVRGLVEDAARLA
jgi:hypothetical protein